MTSSKPMTQRQRLIGWIGSRFAQDGEHNGAKYFPNMNKSHLVICYGYELCDAATPLGHPPARRATALLWALSRDNVVDHFCRPAKSEFVRKNVPHFYREGWNESVWFISPGQHFPWTKTFGLSMSNGGA